MATMVLHKTQQTSKASKAEARAALAARVDALSLDLASLRASSERYPRPSGKCLLDASLCYVLQDDDASRRTLQA